MKGMFFNNFDRYISETYGIEAWETILSESDLESGDVFIGPQVYPDSDFYILLDKAISYLKIEKNELLKDLGRKLFHYYAEYFPDIVDTSINPKQFLLSINDIHQYEVKKLLKVADPPIFTFEDPAPDKVLMTYYSKRKLCPLMEGILLGFSDVFKAPINFTKTACMLKGDEQCSYEITFNKRG